MSRFSLSGLQALGTALVGGGCTVGVGYWIFTLQDSGPHGFWEWPGFVSIALVVAGAVLLMAGLFRREAPDDTRTSRPASQTATTISGGQTIQVSDVTAEGDITISPEQRNG